jgi:hypothetical protein
MATEYTIHGAPITDVRVALECEADRAEREQFAHVAARQRALALHMANADAHLGKLAPDGYRVQLDLVFRIVPNVNAVLRKDLQS